MIVFLIFARRSRRLSIDEQCDCPMSALVDRRETSALVDRAARSTIAIVHRATRRRGAIVGRAARSSIAPLVGVAWRDLGSLFSLSLSLFQEVIWSENEGRKWFPGQRWKYWSTGSHFPENDIFRDSQTLRFYGKWFPETVFTQFKHTLNLKFMVRLDWGRRRGSRVE